MPITRTHTLADGQLAASAAAILAGTSIGNDPIKVSATFTNTSASTTETVVLTMQRSGGTARRICRIVLAPNEQFSINGLPMQTDDTLLGASSNAATVDYVVTVGEGNLSFAALDANGSVKTVRTQQSRTYQIGTPGKVGAGAGWVLSGADNLPYIATMAASQTAGTLVLRIDGLAIGDTITGFKVIAQIESAGGIVTLDAALRAVTNVAAEPTDASIGSITQISVTADTASAVSKTGLSEVVTSGKVYYILLTGTTAASTDIILLGCEITVTTP